MPSRWFFVGKEGIARTPDYLRLTAFVCLQCGAGFLGPVTARFEGGEGNDLVAHASPPFTRWPGRLWRWHRLFG